MAAVVMMIGSASGMSETVDEVGHARGSRAPQPGDLTLVINYNALGEVCNVHAPQIIDSQKEYLHFASSHSHILYM